MKRVAILVLSLVLLPAVARSGDLWISNHTDFPGRKIVLDLVDNEIFTHDVSLLFARSATGIVWSNNLVHVNGELPSWGRPKFVFERCDTFATDVKAE